jgi:hypothetical protein
MARIREGFSPSFGIGGTMGVARAAPGQRGPMVRGSMASGRRAAEVPPQAAATQTLQPTVAQARAPLPPKREARTVTASDRSAVVSGDESAFQAPISLYGAIEVQPGGQSNVQAGAISNNLGRAIEVHEIRFTVTADDTTGYFFDPGGALRVFMSVGGKPLMNVPMPLWNSGKVEGIPVNNWPNDGGQPPGFTALPASNIGVEHVWRLSRPFLLPAGTAVDVSFEHAGNINVTVTGGVALIGRFTAKTSRVTALPYMLFWGSKAFENAVGSDTNAERDLKNVLGRPLHIDRIIGRHASLTSGKADDAAAVVNSFGDGRLDYDHFTAVAPTQAMAKLKLNTSRNQQIIRDAIPFWDLFGTEGSWECPHILAPGDFYRAEIVASTAIAFGSGPPATFQHYANIAFVGWREETL